MITEWKFLCFLPVVFKRPISGATRLEQGKQKVRSPVEPERIDRSTRSSEFAWKSQGVSEVIRQLCEILWKKIHRDSSSKNSAIATYSIRVRKLNAHVRVHLTQPWREFSCIRYRIDAQKRHNELPHQREHNFQLVILRWVNNFVCKICVPCGVDVFTVKNLKVIWSTKLIKSSLQGKHFQGEFTRLHVPVETEKVVIITRK